MNYTKWKEPHIFSLRSREMKQKIWYRNWRFVYMYVYIKVIEIGLINENICTFVKLQYVDTYSTYIHTYIHCNRFAQSVSRQQLDKYCHVYWWLKTGFELVIGFIGYLQVVTTINCYTIADLHTTKHSTLISSAYLL
jgi:hypothetical protein